MAIFTPALFLLAALSSMTVAQQCTDNSSRCPNGQDGISRTFQQCDSWSHQFVQQNCPAGQVCYANPNNPGTAMCGLPGTGDQGRCTGNTAKCVSPGLTGDYLQCESWSSQYVSAKCPSGQRCHNNLTNTGVFCQ